MTRDEQDKALLLRFDSFFGLDLVARQPPGEPLCSTCGSTVEDHNTPPVPQRFWRVIAWMHCPGAEASSWQAVACLGDGSIADGGTAAPRQPTREQAEADGRASGLPEWTGGK
jgi:hypothetical protein